MEAKEVLWAAMTKTEKQFVKDFLRDFGYIKTIYLGRKDGDIILWRNPEERPL